MAVEYFSPVPSISRRAPLPTNGVCVLTRTNQCRLQRRSPLRTDGRKYFLLPRTVRFIKIKKPTQLNPLWCLVTSAYRLTSFPQQRATLYRVIRQTGTTTNRSSMALDAKVAPTRIRRSISCFSRRVAIAASPPLPICKI
jgi:hypothetical protein